MRCNRPAGLECCRRSGDAHGRPGVLSTLHAARRECCRPGDAHAARRECCTQGDAHGRTGVRRRPSTRPAAAHTVRAPAALRHFPARSAERSAPPALRRAPRSGLWRVLSILAEYRGEFSAPSICSTGARTNPATASAAKLFCSVRRFESAAERLGELWHRHTFFGRQRRRETQSPVRLREH